MIAGLHELISRERDPLGVGNWSRLDVSANCSLNAPVTRSGALRSAKRNRGNRERGIPLQILIAFLMENNLIRSARILIQREITVIERERNIFLPFRSGYI